ncbi:PDZ domain-containing protein [Corynebacterium sp. Marseille-P4321]|uniref:YlbL family protein n=1 Tax=Corynebacterium sp. Marseille-P4321 TaxID=2736603 RepID=UPI0020CA590F|nr:PDZ domain-containing protein [Corynebacterium sp. Marseille-P4321]
MNQAIETRNRRYSTLVWGTVPVVLLAGALSIDHIPGTDIKLTVPYAAQGPGPTFDTLSEVEGVPVVDVEGAPTLDTGGRLNMTTVSVRTNMTLAQALTRWITTDDTIVPIEQVFPPEIDEEQMREVNQQAFVASEASATVAAMNYLGRPTIVQVHDVVEDGAAAGVIEPGDTITKVDGKEMAAPGEVQEAVRAKKPGDELALELERDGKTIDAKVTLGENPEEAGQPLLGILMTSEPAGGITVHYNLNDIGGPSAGMMFSLAVIDKLTEGELNGGKFVAGTGTINEDGEVGPIGGIEHKIRGSRDEGAELFLAPEGNCAAVKTTDSGDMVVAAVADLDDAVAAMEDFAAGRAVRGCE